MDLALMAHMRLVALMLINLARPRSSDLGGCRTLQRQVRLPALVNAFSLRPRRGARPYSLQPLLRVVLWTQLTGNNKITVIGIRCCHLIADAIAFNLAFLGRGIRLQHRNVIESRHSIQENND